MFEKGKIKTILPHDPHSALVEVVGDELAVEVPGGLGLHHLVVQD